LTAATETSNAPRVIGVAENYLGFISALRARVAELGISYSTIDQIAGWTDTYATKLLAEEPARFIGPMSFDAILGALGLKFALIEDPERLEKAKRHRDFVTRRHRLPTVKHGTVKHGGYVVQRRTREDMRLMGLEGGRKRAEKLSAAKLKAIARKAARARWRRPRVVEISPRVLGGTRVRRPISEL
jgi:hypothetical protein